MRAACLCLALVAVITSCGPASVDSGTGTGDGGRGDARTSGGQKDAPWWSGDGGSPPVGNLSCSADLQYVVDANGQVVQTCAPDSGCSAGQCVAPCQAAADSHGTVGCNFIVPTPAFYQTLLPPCFAVFIANNWPKAVQIQVTRSGTSLDATQFGRIAQVGVAPASWQAVPASGLPSGQVAVLFLSSDPAASNMFPMTCPVTPAVNAGTAVANSGRGAAFTVTTDVPVSAYDILPFGGARSFLPSAELLLPTTAWGTNYVAVAPRPANGGSSSATGLFWGQVVGMQNNTQVQLLPTVALPAGTGVAAAPAGQVTTYTVNAGEFIQFEGSGDLTGSVIQSDNPVVFIGGNTYLCYSSATSAGGGCDCGHQMIPPVSALGWEYVAPPYTTRRAGLQPESIVYRLVGTVAGTTLTYDPPVAGAPATVNRGEPHDFEATVAFTVKSQDKDHPFYLGQLMSGCQVTGGSRPGAIAIPPLLDACLGDEEYVNILPPAQFLLRYVFFTDPTYATTNLVFVRVKTAAGFKEVKLDCLGGNVSGWQAVGTGGTYEITNFDLVRGGTGNGSCQNGPQVASSDGPFGIIVWGEDSYASYAYPAGGNVAAINTVVVPPVLE